MKSDDARTFLNQLKIPILDCYTLQDLEALLDEIRRVVVAVFCKVHTSARRPHSTHHNVTRTHVALDAHCTAAPLPIGKASGVMPSPPTRTRLFCLFVSHHDHGCLKALSLSTTPPYVILRVVMTFPDIAPPQ